MMLQALLFLAAALAPQDPKPTPKTVEERLKELEDKLSVLEKKHKTLEEENQSLEKKIADAKAMRETWARQTAAGWVKRYAKAVELTEKQSAELEEAWFGWSKEDLEKPADGAKWKAREETVKSKLTEEQVPRLCRKVREEQEQYAKMSLSGFVQMAKIAPERTGAFEKIVMGRLSFPEDTLVPQAHPEKGNSWVRLTAAVEESLPDLSSVLAEDEQARLRETLSKWKPRKPASSAPAEPRKKE